MSRARRFTKAEIMDAARAAAETGLSAKLYPSGEIEFAAGRISGGENLTPSPEAALEAWLNGREARGRA